jgi:hypothetical protein
MEDMDHLTEGMALHMADLEVVIAVMEEWDLMVVMDQCMEDMGE